jgi:hypothetical protein
MSIGWQRQSGSLIFKGSHKNTLLTLSETTLTINANLSGGIVLPASVPITASGAVSLNLSSAGGDSPQLLDLNVTALTGTSGFRQGAINVSLTRAAGQEFIATWDGNADEAIKVVSRNSGNNLDGVTRIGAVRALNVQARNSGTNLSWVKTIEANARNDSGKNVSDMVGMHLRMENYGNIMTSSTAIDLELSDENLTQSQSRTGILIRNTDASGMAAVNQVFKVSHTSTNGFTYLFHFNAATGDTFTAGDVAPHADPSASHMGADGYLTVLVNATPYYIPCYNSTE